MQTNEKLYTIGVAAKEFGIAYETFRRRYKALGIFPEIRIPHSPMAKGFTEAQMAELRRHLKPEAVAASA